MNASLSSKTLTCLFGRWLALTILVSLLIGCKTANYGKFKQSHEVEKLFTSGQVLPDHKYYYAGSNSRPSTVMGINNNYTLDDEFWDKTENIQRDLKLWVGDMGKRENVWGYYILAPDGQQIGIYYSNRDAGWVTMGENNQVTISTPDRLRGGDGGRGK